MSLHEKIEKYIYSHAEEMFGVLSELVKIPSVKGEPAEGAPFGAEPRRALAKMLEICENYGFETSVCENVAGSAELCPNGTAAELGILCHLDVVPAAAEGWSVPPFALTRRDGLLLGRGVIDDKGPAAASLFAMRCIKELEIPLKKGVRLIFGTDEENGSEDLEIYRRHVKLPPNVFTPDGSFPVINIEKGMMRSRFSGEYEKGSVTRFEGGSIPNAVPDSARAELIGISAEEVRARAAEFGGKISVSENGGSVLVEFSGRAAHASTPEGGINAVTGLLAFLAELPLAEGKQSEIICGLSKKFPFGESDGASCGLKSSDEKSGALTCVFSIFSMNETACSGCVDVRFPTCLNLAEVERIEREAFGAAGCRFDEIAVGEEPHCTDENSEFVQSLLRVYERCEGELGRCIAIGGGTYVHTIDGGVAFGAERGDTDYHMHGADEFIPEDELLRDAVIFAEAIAEICG